jgi:hypothetical protein
VNKVDSTQTVYRPYPGVALVVTPWGSVLLGAPADAFKATRRFCDQHALPFPKVLVAPPRLVVQAVPQFVPEFFLYDFLFVHGAAFKPELMDTRLQFVMRPEHMAAAKKALTMTLVGPSHQELLGYAEAAPDCGLDAETCTFLSGLSRSMAIKKAGHIRQVDDMVDMVPFDANGQAQLFAGRLQIVCDDTQTLRLRSGGAEVAVDLSQSGPVTPFATLPRPQAPLRPQTFGMQALGTRSGFDLSGPTTGFVLWVNGRAILYDGPVGTRHLLASQGLTLDDIDGIVLSHCHEDHMGSFVEMLLSGARPKVYTAEPIYRSALVKLASYFNCSEAAAAQLMDYVPVSPQQPKSLLGADFHFFYTAHAIPTLGVAVQLLRGSRRYGMQISGDTLHHAGLDKMHQEGTLSAARCAAMKHRIPEKKVPNQLYLADVGEALIHGHPQDWADNPNDVVYYHCPDSAHTRSFNHPVAQPGAVYSLLEAPQTTAILPARLLRALQALQIDSPATLSHLLHAGTTRTYAAGDKVQCAGSQGSDKQLCLVVAGGLQPCQWPHAANVRPRAGADAPAESASAAAAAPGPDGEPAAKAADTPVAGTDLSTALGPGDFFGYFTAEHAYAAQPLEAAIPSEVFHLDTALLTPLLCEPGQQAWVRSLCRLRPLIDRCALFAQLPPQMRTTLAHAAQLLQAAPGAVLPTAGKEQSFLLLLSGTARASGGVGTPSGSSGLLGPQSFVGQHAVLNLPPPHSEYVVQQEVQCLSIACETLRLLCKKSTVLQQTLLQAAQ